MVRRDTSARNPAGTGTANGRVHTVTVTSAQINALSPGGENSQGRCTRSNRYRRTTLYRPPRIPSVLRGARSWRISAVGRKGILSRYELEADNSHTLRCARCRSKTMRSGAL